MLTTMTNNRNIDPKHEALLRRIELAEARAERGRFVLWLAILFVGIWAAIGAFGAMTCDYVRPVADEMHPMLRGE